MKKYLKTIILVSLSVIGLMLIGYQYYRYLPKKVQTYQTVSLDDSRDKVLYPNPDSVIYQVMKKVCKQQ